MRLLFLRYFRSRKSIFPGSEEFQAIIKYNFKDTGLLKLALSHRSYIHSQKQDLVTFSNERLEFLGDAVLDLVITEYLYQRHSKKKEGELSKLKSLIVSSKVLALCAKNWNMGKYIRFSHSEKKAGGGARTSILADTYEALLGGVFLDGGLKAARKIVKNSLIPMVDSVVSDRDLHNFKSELLEYLQSKGKSAPKYELVKESGPEHKKTFTVTVKINGELLGSGRGMSKKDAEQAAARTTLKGFIS